MGFWLAALTFGAGSASAAARAGSTTRHVDVVQIGGILDPVNANLLSTAIRTATDDGAVALVVQLDAKTSDIATARACALAQRMRGSASAPPVAMWVGPAGRGRALRAAYRLFEAADVKGVAPGARLGDAAACPGAPDDRLSGRSLSGQSAVAEGLADVLAPTLSNFIGELDGRRVGRTGDVLSTLEPLDQVPPGKARGLASDLDVRFLKASLLDRLLHGLGSPSAAYLLLVIGLLCVLFEFFTAGVGIAAAAGTIAILLSAYGLGTLPTRPWAVALLVLAVVGYGVDLQSGVPRAWTVIGTALFIVGSVELFGGHRLPLVTSVLVLAATLTVVLAGMPSVVRTRFATPTIGRESMVGEMGTAVGAVDPDGTVIVRGAQWRARTNRATPIPAGDAIRVVGIDGLLLEVEPETGGAREAHH